MNKFYHSVRLKVELCKGCINCIKRCPTQAIRVQNGKAKINSESCIDCGECIRICQNHAKVALYDGLDVMENYEYLVALPAPSLYSQFNNLEDTNVVLTALKLMGFDDVLEVSAAAEIVSEASRIYIEEHKENLPYISTACPSVVRLIRVRFPQLIGHLLPIKPPVEVAAILAARRAMKKTGLPREKIGVIFISPCPSKVSYARSPLGVEKSEVDAVLAIKEVYPRLLPFMKEAQKEPAELACSGRIGVGWGRRGGEAAGLLTDSYLAADGVENVIRVLEDLEDQKLENVKFVELNTCSGGCVGGVLNVENPYAAEVKLKRLSKYTPVARARLSDRLKGDMEWTVPVEYEPVLQLGSNRMESFMKLNQVEELCRELPGLDCGCCGAPSCKALAEDIVRKTAVKTDCIYYMRSILGKISDSLEKMTADLKPGDILCKEELELIQESIYAMKDEVSQKRDTNGEKEEKV